MARCPDVWISGWPDVWIARCLDSQMSRWPEVRMARHSDGQMAGWPEVQMAGCTDGCQKSRWPKGQLVRKPDILISSYMVYIGYIKQIPKYWCSLCNPGDPSNFLTQNHVIQ